MGTTIGIAVAVILLVAVVAIVAFIATRPDTFRIERSALLSAPAAAVFPWINDFHQWRQWSPYERLDPELQRTFAGPAAGVGAGYGWSGNSKAGSGRMTIEESRPGSLVRIKLEFIKPFEATCQSRFTLTPENGGARVTWHMEGPNTLMGKAMSLFINMDKMVGKDFEQGLANLDVLTRTEARNRG